METLNNFSSIYCFITFIMGAVFMFIAVCVVAMGKVKEPRNKVHFYIAKPSGYYMYYLYLGKPRRVFSNGKFIFKSAHNGRFITDDVFDYGLNPRDYDDMKIGEIKEVFLNLED